MAKIALITGASKGIGRAIALGLAQDTFDIWLNYRADHAAAQKVQKEIEEMGQSCILVPFDVCNAQEVDKALTPLLEENVPYALINNAGFAKDTIFGLMGDDDWSKVLDVHLNGFYHITRKIAPHMQRKRTGRIVNISSTSGQTGVPGQVNYCTAKAGLIGATKALAKELAKRNVLVNAVAPGFIETSMTEHLVNEEYMRAIPMARSGKPEEVAGCVRFLCSDMASYVTGQVLALNGGLYM